MQARITKFSPLGGICIHSQHMLGNWGHCPPIRLA